MNRKIKKMTLREIKDLLKCEVVIGDDNLDLEVLSGGGCDLMSDVLAFGKPGMLLLTGLTNAQSVKTADIVDIKAIIYVRGKKPDKEGIELAKKKGIPLLSTKHMMFEACGILYSAGLPSVNETEKND